MTDTITPLRPGWPICRIAPDRSVEGGITPEVDAALREQMARSAEDARTAAIARVIARRAALPLTVGRIRAAPRNPQRKLDIEFVVSCVAVALLAFAAIVVWVGP